MVPPSGLRVCCVYIGMHRPQGCSPIPEVSSGASSRVLRIHTRPMYKYIHSIRAEQQNPRAHIFASGSSLPLVLNRGFDTGEAELTEWFYGLQSNIYSQTICPFISPLSIINHHSSFLTLSPLPNRTTVCRRSTYQTGRYRVYPKSKLIDLLCSR